MYCGTVCLEEGNDEALGEALQRYFFYEEESGEQMDLRETCWHSTNACWKFRRASHEPGRSGNAAASKALHIAFSLNKHVPFFLLHLQWPYRGEGREMRDLPGTYLGHSSSLEVLPDLMHDILRTWSLPDLRLLGHIMLYKPLEVAQDIIHTYQKRHPLGMTHMSKAVKHQFLNIKPDCMRSLASDVYFVPYRPHLRMYKTPAEYAAKLVLGRVVTDLQISSQTRRRLSGSSTCRRLMPDLSSSVFEY